MDPGSPVPVLRFLGVGESGRRKVDQKISRNQELNNKFPKRTVLVVLWAGTVCLRQWKQERPVTTQKRRMSTQKTTDADQGSDRVVGNHRPYPNLKRNPLFNLQEIAVAMWYPAYQSRTQLKLSQSFLLLPCFTRNTKWSCLG